MNKESFIKEINKKLENISLDDSKKIIINIMDKLPTQLYEKSLFIIDNILGNLEYSETKEDDIREIENEFKLIENGELTFKSYSYETGNYYYYDAEYDTKYFDEDNLSEILTSAYNLGITLVNNKKYKLALKIFDLILYTNYQCQEMGDPEYDFSGEIYDTYDIDLSSVEDLLDFDLNNLYSYSIYATYFINDKDKYYKIYNYLKDCPNIKIEDSYNLGIEKMTNLDNFYRNFADYLTTIPEKNSINILKYIIDLKYVDEYEICKKSFKTHPKLYLNYILKLFENNNYEKIIETVPNSLEEINEPLCRNDICYIMVDSIILSKKNLDINKYLYEAFLSINNLPNFLVLLYHKLYDDKIKNLISSIKYNNNDNYELSSEVYIEDKKLFDFFLGNFETIYEKYKNKNTEITYLMMLYLNNNLLNGTKIKDIIIKSLTQKFTKFHYKNLDINIDNKEIELLKLFNEWKDNNPIDEELKIKFINKFKNDIMTETEYILTNKIRSSYYAIARKIVMLDEVLASNDIIIKGMYISEYEKKYVRYNAFRKEIKELLN